MEERRPQRDLHPAECPLPHWIPILVGIIIVILATGFGIYNYLYTDSLPNTPLNKMAPGNASQKNNPADSELDTFNWNTYRNEEYGFEFSYPSFEDSRYIIPAQPWPPKITVQDGTTRECDANEKNKRINGRIYCVRQTEEGAAGSNYITYIYTTFFEDNIVKIQLTMRYVQCGVFYGQPEEAECIAEQRKFDPDQLVDAIVASMKIINK